MFRASALVFSLLYLASPALAGHAAGPDDGTGPFERILEALEQGRHWYAARLLRDIGVDTGDPRATLLAARADAGLGSWTSVARRLRSEPWLDSLQYGEGRALLARAWLETGMFEAAAESYRTFLRYSVERVPRSMAQIGLARALVGLGRPRAASIAFMRAAEEVPELTPWMSIRAAESLAPTGDTVAVGQLLAQADEIPYPRRVLAEVLAAESAGDLDHALRLLVDAAESPAAGNSSAEFRTRAARLLLVQGDTGAAGGILRLAIRFTPRQAGEAAAVLADLPGLNADDHRRLARAFERASELQAAAREYGAYLETAGASRSERQRVTLEVGELLFRSGAYFAAIAELEALLKTEPDRATAAQAEYLIARATYRQGWRQEGRNRFHDVAERYAGSAQAIRALSLLGDVYESAGNTPRARDIYQELADRYYGSNAANTALYRLGLMAFVDGVYAAATRQFDRLRRSERRPELRVRAMYWAAKARLADGDPETDSEAESILRSVQGRDPFGYYGLLAADRIGADPWVGLPAGPDPRPPAPEVLERLEVVKLLRAAGLAEEAETVVQGILRERSRQPDELLGLSRALLENGFGQEAVRLGWSAHSRLLGRWSLSVLRAIYPLAFEDIILAEARERRIDPHLVAAVVRQESAFDPTVISRAGARGLLQIMPYTGRWLADRLSIADYSDDVLFHPELNIYMGTAYFADLRRRYEDLQLTLIAYNAGPTRARRWKSRAEFAIDAELFAERLPFSETRSYVKNIAAHIRIYENLYGDFGAAQLGD